ncbi:hypothetical protein SAMN04487948_12741 [Halogranum amylolyticum]|uniref:Uncharacterized protein n=1 Tax=Halogranum amylolyticum TaxID=660520 RepID=A0A1H8WDP1_9EURY|nr:hypothetical protein SAMN04487948_12741 [Halogranum amylolyticum]
MVPENIVLLLWRLQYYFCNEQLLLRYNSVSVISAASRLHLPHRLGKWSDTMIFTFYVRFLANHSV